MPSSQPLRQFEAAFPSFSVFSMAHLTMSCGRPFKDACRKQRRRGPATRLDVLGEQSCTVTGGTRCQGCRTRRYQWQGKGAEASTRHEGSHLVALYSTLRSSRPAFQKQGSLQVRKADPWQQRCPRQSSDCPDSASCPKANHKFASLSVDDDVEVWTSAASGLLFW